MIAEKVLRQLVFPVLTLAIAGEARADHDLLITEYVEGLSNDKALQIYNPTATAVMLSDYAIEIYANGAATPGVTIVLPAVLLVPSDVFVIANPLATFAASADLTVTALNFNGNDTVALVRGSTRLDVIGQVGFEPGTEWGSDFTSTADNTLVRNQNVCDGDPDGTDVFDPAVEWVGFPTGYTGDLDYRGWTCKPRPVPSLSMGGITVLAMLLGSIHRAFRSSGTC